MIQTQTQNQNQTNTYVSLVREYRPYQWPHVSLAPWGTLQIGIRFVMQRLTPTLETNKHVGLVRTRLVHT